MKLLTYEYVSVADWCRSISEDALMRETGNLVYFGAAPEEPPIALPAFRAPGEAPDEIWASVAKMGRSFDRITRIKTPPRELPFVARLENARVERPNFSVFVSSHLVMAESYHDADSTEGSKTWHGPFATRRGAELVLNASGGTTATLNIKYYIDRDIDQHISEPALLLAGLSNDNYHHWMMEILPRLAWCEMIPALRDLPILVPSPLLPFQAETLTALGIAPQRLRLFTGAMLQADVLYFPSYYAPGNLSARNVVWTRDRLHAGFGIEAGPARDLIYVSRRDARKRRVLNEAEVIARLQARGFRIVTLEGLSVREQAQMFSTAKLVAMPHGAAGTNMIFAPDGAALIEFLPRSYPHIAYWVYASHNNCRYGRLICNDVANTQDVSVDLKALDSIIDQALT